MYYLMILKGSDNDIISGITSGSSSNRSISIVEDCSEVVDWIMALV